MPVSVHIYKNGIDITPELEYRATSSHECGYKMEEIFYRGEKIGERESGLVSFVRSGYNAKIVPE